jgi:hypothetical protein
MITALGDGSVEDFLKWSHQAGHYTVSVAYANYKEYCEYIKEHKNELAEKQRYVEE